MLKSYRELDNLIDAQQMAVEHPGSFEAPSISDLKRLKRNHVVKICRNGERFWVLIKHIEGDIVQGTIANRLTVSENAELPYGTRVQFEKRHIYQTE